MNLATTWNAYTVCEYNLMDKSEWHRGPWDNEPDKLSWLHPKGNTPCFIVRGQGGDLSGYISISELLDVTDLNIHIHNGLDYSGYLIWEGFPHLGYDNPNMWWLGFSCNHIDDFVPAAIPHGTKHPPPSIKNYKTIGYVIEEVNKLITQLGIT